MLVKLEMPLNRVSTLVRTTNEPTTIYIVRIGILPTRRAAMGAAIRPPIMRPATSNK